MSKSIGVNLFTIRGWWYVDYRKKGRRVKKALKTRDEARARQFASALRSGLNKRAGGQDKEWDARNWLRVLWLRAKRAEKERSIPCSLTFQQMELLAETSGGVCAVSGIPFSWDQTDAQRRRPFAPSLDRKDSTQGYHLDNVRLVCSTVNAGLGEWGDELYIRVCRAVAARAS